jgi:hypothetical protein
VRFPCVTSASYSYSDIFITLMLGLQTQSSAKPTYSGPFHAIKLIYSQHGLAGLYKGQASTLLREGIGYAIYFGTYETLVQNEMKKKGLSRKEISPTYAILYGATAGLIVCPFRHSSSSSHTLTDSIRPYSCGLAYTQ